MDQNQAKSSDEQKVKTSNQQNSQESIIKNLETQILNQKKEIGEKQIQLNKQRNQITELQNFKKDDEDIIKQLQKIILIQDRKLQMFKDHNPNQIRQINEKLEQLFNNNNIQKQQQNERIQNEERQKNFKHQMEDLENNQQGYDLQIQFEKIKDIVVKGSKLEFKDDITYNIETSEQVQLVSFLGLKNTGKSYWHSQLSGKNIYQGLMNATVGLNISFQENVWFIDTPGLGETLQNFDNDYKEKVQKYVEAQQQIESLKQQQQKSDNDNQNKQQQKQAIQELINYKNDLLQKIEETQKQAEKNQLEIYKDRISLENFVQSFIIEQSNVIIYVCDILSLEEQRYITQIQQKLKQNQVMYILHNLKSIKNVEDLNKSKQKDILNNFPINIKDASKSQYKFTQSETGDYNKDITHLIFGYDGNQQIIEQYNNLSKQYLLNQINNLQGKFKRQDFFNSFKEFTENNIQEYLNLQPDANSDDSGQQQKKDWKPEFEVLMDQKQIIMKNLNQIDENSIYCKEIITNFLGQKENYNDIGEHLYNKYIRTYDQNKHILTVLINLPCMDLLEGNGIKCKLIHDYDKKIKLLNISVKYKPDADEFYLDEDIYKNEIRTPGNQSNSQQPFYQDFEEIKKQIKSYDKQNRRQIKLKNHKFDILIGRDHIDIQDTNPEIIKFEDLNLFKINIKFTGLIN